MREDHSTWYDASTESFPSRAAVGARLRAAVARRRLVYGVIGYSITVGRGNYFNQSWPAALERRLARALPGVAVEVRNMAVGASPPYPTCACLAETVGPDVDVVAWEFGMTGGNDGEENLFRSCLRKALELPSRPAFVLIDSQTRRTDVLRRLGALSTVVNLRRAFLASKEDGDGDRWAKQGMPEGCKAAKWHPGVGWHDLTAAVVLRNARARGDEQEHEGVNQHRVPRQPRARVRRPDSTHYAVWALQVFFAAGNTRV